MADKKRVVYRRIRGRIVPISVTASAAGATAAAGAGAAYAGHRARKKSLMSKAVEE